MAGHEHESDEKRHDPDGGLSGGIGILLLYAALAVGPMSVLSPLTAVFSGVVPVVVGIARGASLSPLGIGALVVATAAIVLVAAVRDDSGTRLTTRGVIAAVAAGCGFGGLVLAYDATPTDSGVAPLLIARVLQAVLLGAVAGVTAVVTRRRKADGAGSAEGGGGEPTPRIRNHLPRAVLWAVVACGLADAGANIFIQAGLHSSTAPSTLPTMSVLNALYPIGTVILAGVVLRERLTRIQTFGIALAVAASVGLALS